MKITEKILDLTTGQETTIERNETAAETAEREAFEVKVLALETAQAQANAAKTAAQAKLAALGLTTDDLKALGL